MLIFFFIRTRKVDTVGMAATAVHDDWVDDGWCARLLVDVAARSRHTKRQSAARSIENSNEGSSTLHL